MKETYYKLCVACKEEKTVEAHEKDMKEWQRGKHIQNAMPYLSAGDRELLISGICEPCFDKMFGEEE